MIQTWDFMGIGGEQKHRQLTPPGAAIRKPEIGQGTSISYCVIERAPHPTPPHPGVFGNLMGVLGYLMGVLGYLVGVLGYPMAWRQRQAMAKRRWGRRKWRGPPIPGPGPGPRHFLRPKRPLAMAWRRRQVMGYPRTPIRYPRTPITAENAH